MKRKEIGVRCTSDHENLLLITFPCWPIRLRTPFVGDLLPLFLRFLLSIWLIYMRTFEQSRYDMKNAIYDYWSSRDTRLGLSLKWGTKLGLERPNHIFNRFTIKYKQLVILHYLLLESNNKKIYRLMYKCLIHICHICKSFVKSI